MFRGVRQCGFIPVLQSFGSDPLDTWGVKVKNGCIRRVTDEQVRALALELAGANVSTCFVYCPKDPRSSLGIYMPYLVMIIKSLKKYFTFEVTILDDRNVHRRFRMSNFQKMNRIHYFDTSMPLCLNPGWNEIYFDLADFTRKAYKTNYVETTRIQIHANCRIRVIYFCDRIYPDKDIPQKFKIFLPRDHICPKKSEEVITEKTEGSQITDYEGEYEYEEEGEGLYPEESIRSVTEAEPQKVASQGIISVGISEEGEYEGGPYPGDDFPDDGDDVTVKQETDGQPSDAETKAEEQPAEDKAEEAPAAEAGDEAKAEEG